jgi:hypothetical protein
MEKQSLEQIIQQSSHTEHSEKDFYSDVALKILLRTMTPVTVPASFEQSVLNKVAILEPTKLYKSFIAGTSFYALISFLLISFSSLIDSEISTFRINNSKETIDKPFQIPSNSLEIQSSSTLSNSIDKPSQVDESMISKKKTIKRKNINKATQTPIPPPPKGIE